VDGQERRRGASITLSDARLSPTAEAAIGNASGPQPSPLVLSNLLITFAELADLLEGELSRRAPLNSFLLTAAMSQVLEDYLHPEPWLLALLPGRLDRMRAAFGPAAGSVARATAAGWSILRRRRRGAAALMPARAALAALLERLADAVVCPGGSARLDADAVAAGRELLASAARLPPDLRSELVRIPSCFRGFDQDPADLDRLGHDFALRWPDRARPLAVVGVRTSGSYLAPLCAAALRRRGYGDVRTLTIRPGHRLLAPERATLREVAGRDGLVLLTDDPPASGDSLARALSDLGRAGVPAARIVLLLQLFGGRDALPPSLRGQAAVLLPWDEWAVHRRLTPAAVRSTLAELLGPSGSVGAVERLGQPTGSPARGHVRARYRVQLVDVCGERREQEILVVGVGLGYLGEHALAVARQLRPFVPELYGLRAGLLYRAWLPEARRLRPGAPETVALAGPIVAYTVARRRAFGVARDVTPRLGGRLPAWEAASQILCRVFGRGRIAARPLVDPYVRRLLRPTQPAVVDGNMALENWFSDHGRLRKVDAEQRAFSNRNLYSFDPVFDLAGVAAGAADELPRRLRDAYERLAGEPIDEERWLLYELVHIWDAQRQGAPGRSDADQRFARAVQSYFSALFFRDVRRPPAGPIAAVDIDGVLETDHLGFPSTSPAGARSLRALARHGFRAVLVSGRSLDDVRDRCRAYGLAGGVAEYGAVVYSHDSGCVRSLLPAGAPAELDRLRERLSAFDGVDVDPAYRYIVRAYRRDRSGTRRALPAETVAAALGCDAPAARIRPVVGQGQTDFVPAGVDKGAGLRCLVADLGEDRIALAVGDTISDLPMLRLAERAFAPANADRALRAAGVPLLSRRYQLGLAQATARLLGHQPGRCPICAVPEAGEARRLLLTLLGAREAGARGLARAALVLSRRGSRI
jgi:trehalose-6-phosphatase